MNRGQLKGLLDEMRSEHGNELVFRSGTGETERNEVKVTAIIDERPESVEKFSPRDVDDQLTGRVAVVYIDGAERRVKAGQTFVYEGETWSVGPLRAQKFGGVVQRYAFIATAGTAR